MDRRDSHLFACTPLYAPKTDDPFVTRACAFLDDVIPALTEQIKALDQYAECCDTLGRAFTRFSYQFDADEEGTVTCDLMHSLSATGAFCSLIRASHGGGLKKELTALLENCTSLRERFTRCQTKTAKREWSMAETAAELNMLQLEFVSQVLDDCARLLGAYFEVNKEEGEVLCPVATQKAPVWVSRAGELQKSEQAMRERVAVPRSPDRLRSPSRRSLLPKCPVFGVPLEMLPLVPGFHVPLILFDTTEALLNNQEHLETEGLFRVSATKTKLQAIQTALDNGQVVGFGTYDTPEITGTLKQWLQMLPEPLIPYRSFPHFTKNAEGSPELLKKLVATLPPLNLRCLHKLMDTLHTVALHSDKNKMHEENLAMVFAPTLLRDKNTKDSNPLKTNSALTHVLANILNHYDYIFGPFTV